MRLNRLIAAFLFAFWAPLPATNAAELLPADRSPVQAIDHYVRAKWAANGVKTAKPAVDSALVRRLMLDLAGRTPTAEEARGYVESKDADKRRKLVDRLMASPDFAFHQRNWLDGFLLAEKKNDDRWREYLLKAVREKRAWNAMFREMLIAPDTKQEPAASLEFLKARASSPHDMTNDVSRLFFGVAINCAQCHDHPLVDDWKQDHYFGLLSFFDRTYLTKKNTLAEKHNGEVKFKTTAGKEKTARYMFVTGTAIETPRETKSKDQIRKEDAEVKRQKKDKNAPDPQPPAFSPRARLVELALRENERRFFTRNIVNRVWARFFGRGLVDPLDQMHSGNDPSHPRLLDWLARDLVAHKYDLERLIAGIVLSEAYALSSRWSGAGTPPDPQYFAVAQPRVLSPRQYALSLIVASLSSEEFKRHAANWAKYRDELERRSDGFSRRFERPGANFQVSVDEALLFSNDKGMQDELLRDGKDRLVYVLKGIDDDRRLIDAAYRAILSRPPEADELATFAAYLAERKDRRVPGIQQVVWALLTGPEMRFNY